MNEKPTPKTAILFHDVRGSRIFLCISPDLGEVDLKNPTTEQAQEMSRAIYSCEREIPADCKPGTIALLAAEIENETGLKVKLSQILKEEMGVQ